MEPNSSETRVTFEMIWSEWWEIMTWPTKLQWQWQRQKHLENTLKERSLRLLRHMIRVLRKYDLTNRMTGTKTKTKTQTKTKTFRELFQRAIFWLLTFDTFDQSGEKTWTTKRTRQRQIYLETPSIFETFDQRFLRFWRHKRTSSNGNPREVVILLTFLTIENLKNYNQSDNNVWHWTAFAILSMFSCGTLLGNRYAWMVYVLQAGSTCAAKTAIINEILGDKIESGLLKLKLFCTV